MDKSQKHTDQVKLLIDREIWCNQSHLVDALLKNSDSDNDARLDWDDIINFYVNTEEEAKEMGYESLEAMQDSDGADKEVFEWWLISDWLARKLEEISAVIIKSDYGTWWGRTETGQSLTMDSDINAVAANVVNSASYIE